MNGRALAISSGCLVLATGTALIGSASAAADEAPERARPAVSHRNPARASRASALPVGLPSVDPAVKAHNDAVVIARFAEAVNTARGLEAVAAIESAQQAEALARARAPRPAAQRSSRSGGGNVLECIKHRESRGQYDVVNTSSGAAGAYQFMPGTWNNNAASAGRTDLVGVNPSNASPEDQDAMAQHLLATQGLGPWGGGCG